MGEDFKFDIDHCSPSNLAEHWLASKLNQAAGEISESLESYDFHIALDTLTKFVWDDYADWFIESAKKEYNPHFLYLSLINTLIIAHSFAPFVTETIWQTLPFTEGLVAQEVWPKPLKFSDFEAQQFKDVAELVTTVRSIQKLNSGSKLKLSFNDDVVAKTRQLIASLAKAELIDEVNTEGYKIASNNLSLTIVMSREELSTLKTKLTEQIDALHARREALETRLTNKSYIEGAPKELVDQSREELDSINHQISNAKKQLSLV